MKEEIITIEKALENFRILMESFVGKKSEHIILDKCYNKIVEDLKISKITEDVKE